MKNLTLSVQKSQSNTRAFSTRKHPLFGRGKLYSESNPPEGVTRSPFYWWFKFAQLNDEYQQALKGKKSTVDKQVVKDFGDVRNTDFKSWWIKRIDLFAEPQLDYRMVVATKIDEIAPFDDKQVINLVVPLNWTNVGIKRSFARIIDQLVPKQTKGKRAKGVKLEKPEVVSEAKYKIGRKWSITGFEYAYKVYLIKRENDLLVKQGGKKLYWADIAIKAELPSYMRYKEGKSIYNENEIRRLLTILAKRHYKKAEEYIKASISNIFP